MACWADMTRGWDVAWAFPRCGSVLTLRKAAGRVVEIKAFTGVGGRKKGWEQLKQGGQKS